MLEDRAETDPSLDSRALLQSAWVQESKLPNDVAVSAWHKFAFPGKRLNRHSGANWQGRSALKVDSHKSVSMVRKHVNVDMTRIGRLRFSWHVPKKNALADIAHHDHDDAPVRIVLAFDGDRSSFSVKNSMLNELSRALIGEEMPYATLMYSWADRHALGSVVHSPRTDRIRSIVVESGEAGLGRWLDYERDVVADYRNAFGEMPGRLIGIAVMSDTDNTGHSGTVWYGPIALSVK